MRLLMNDKDTRKEVTRNKNLISAQQRLITAKRIGWKDAINFRLQITVSIDGFGRKDIPYLKIGEIVSLDTLTLMPEPIKVTPRQTGMTATGTSAHCHANVRELVNNYGGKMITGYELCGSPNGMILNWHSVWQTPEGKVVDVTQLHGREEGEFHNRISDYLFVPICVSQDNLFPNSKGYTPVLSGNKMEWFGSNDDSVMTPKTEGVFKFKNRNAIKTGFYSQIRFVFKKSEHSYHKTENGSQFRMCA